MTVVVAAVIERDGKILVCRRTAAQAHPLKWEFPGGKVEPGEMPGQALARELDEELAIRAEIGPEITRYEFTYPGKKPILLIFFRVHRYEGELLNRIFDEMRWEAKSRLQDYDFLEDDAGFVKALTAGEW